MNPMNAERRRFGWCAAGTLAACVLGAAPSALGAGAAPKAPRATTKAAHAACKRRAARAHRHVHCPPVTLKPAVRPSPPQPYASYHVPLGPLLTVEQATARAVAVANSDNEPAPTVDSVRLTTVGQEDAALAAAGGPQLAEGIPATPGFTAYLNSPEYVVVMDGHFTLNNAQGTNGMPLPKGTVLQVILDAHTGQPTSTRLLS